MFLFSLLFFSEEIQLRANRTPHTPPHVLLFFFSVPAAFVCSLVLAVRPFCSGVSRDFSEAFFLDARRQRRLLNSVRGLLFSRSVVFAASHVSSGPCTLSQEGRPAGGLARSPCPSEGKGSIALLGWRDSDPLLFVFFCVASVCFGSQGPKSPSVRRGASFGAPEALAHLFPRLSLSSLFLSVLPLFCFDFACAYVFFSPRRTSFFADLVFLGRFFAISCGRIFVATLVQSCARVFAMNLGIGVRSFSGRVFGP